MDVFYKTTLHVNLLAVDFLPRSQVHVSPPVCQAAMGGRGALSASGIHHHAPCPGLAASVWPDSCSQGGSRGLGCLV